MSDSRQQFEAWAGENTKLHLYYLPRLGCYSNTDTELAWLVWQAREESMYNMMKVYNDVAALLPDTRYMDPPDGGDVEVAEQIRRMIADKVQQAFTAGIAQGRKGLPEWTDSMSTDEYLRSTAP